jgi:DNA polymerase III alpha subunit
MDNIPLFGRRKNGLEAIEYPHEKLSGILAETYGIFVYQEQVMQAAQILAGYSLGDADLLRRAMGKKIQAEMDQQRLRFVAGCKEVSQIEANKANELFDLIDKFAGYGFNKSHAAAYALLAYHTAWFKAHYPHEFYAASMCFDMHQSEKLNISWTTCAATAWPWPGRTSTIPKPNSPWSAPPKGMPCAMPWRACATWAKRRWTRSWPSGRPMGRSPRSTTCSSAFRLAR